MDVRPARPSGLARALGIVLSGSDRLGGGSHRGDLHDLPAAAEAAQAPEVDEHAGRFNGELRRRTRVVPIFPNDASCQRLIRAPTLETRERWLEENHYLNIEYAREQRNGYNAKRRQGSGRVLGRKLLQKVLDTTRRPGARRVLLRVAATCGSPAVSPAGPPPAVGRSVRGSFGRTRPAMQRQYRPGRPDSTAQAYSSGAYAGFPA